MSMFGIVIFTMTIIAIGFYGALELNQYLSRREQQRAKKHD